MSFRLVEVSFVIIAIVMNDKPKHIAINYFIAAMALGFLFILCLKPLSDPDLWWHLKHGQWMAEHRALLGNEDPFSFTTPSPLSEAQVTALRGQWLGQLGLYGAYAMAGYAGVVMLKAFLMVLPFVLALRLSRSGAAGVSLSALLAVAVPLLVMAAYLSNTFERPQGFSFALALPMYLALLKARRGAHLAWYLAPAGIMALWANLHGGYVVGAWLMAAFALADVLAHGTKRLGLPLASECSARPMMFYASCVLAFLAMGLNPAGYQFLGWTVSISKTALAPALSSGNAATIVVNEVLEYRPLMFFYQQLHMSWALYVMVFYAIAIATLLAKYIHQRKVDFSEALACAFLIVFAMRYARGVGFSLAVLGYCIATTMSHSKALARYVTVALGIALVFIATGIYRQDAQLLKPSLPQQWVSPGVPEQQARFILEHKIQGRMFNTLSWGGYFIWRLGPERQVFFDGREISPQVTKIYKDIISGNPNWRGVLESYGVNFMVLPVLNPINGSLFPVIFHLIEQRSEGWQLVYAQDNAVIFIKRDGLNSAVIECCSLALGELYQQVDLQASIFLESHAGHPTGLMAKAMALYWQGDYEGARALFMSLPGDRLTEMFMRRIEGTGR